MMKANVKRLVILVIICVALNVISSCRLYDDRIELGKDRESKFYSINTKTIIEAIAQGNTDVFTLQSASLEPKQSIPEDSLHWRQQDYFRIAKVLHKLSWGESLDNQNLYSVSFDMDCSDAGNGTFSKAEFKSFKIVQIGDEEVRFERWIIVTPLENTIHTLETEYRPNVNLRKPFDLEQYQITAEDGLQVAEKNGGNAVRLAVDNKCNISAIAPSVEGKEWRITYANFPNIMDLLLKISIDPQTGEYKVIYPKQ